MPLVSFTACGHVICADRPCGACSLQNRDAVAREKGRTALNFPNEEDGAKFPSGHLAPLAVRSCPPAVPPSTFA